MAYDLAYEFEHVARCFWAESKQMVQIIYEDGKTWAEGERFLVQLPSLKIELAISPDMARRKANGYLVSAVSMTLHAVNPVLIINSHPRWRFTLEMRLRGLGSITTLGTIDVDAQQGCVIPLSNDQIRKIQDQANAIITRLARTAA